MLSMLLDTPAFRLYAVCAVILVIKMYAVGTWTSVVRTRRKVILNAEDAKGVSVATSEHPDVERGLRAHRNDLENIPSFLALGLVHVLSGGPLLGAQICFVTFTVARLAHSYAYLNALQPWRSVSYGVALLSTVAIAVQVIVRMLT